MVLAWSGKVLLWGHGYNAGHLSLAKGDWAAEVRVVLGSDLTRCWFLHPVAGLSFYVVAAFFMSCINCGELRIYLQKHLRTSCHCP